MQPQLGFGRTQRLVALDGRVMRGAAEWALFTGLQLFTLAFQVGDAQLQFVSFIEIVQVYDTLLMLTTLLFLFPLQLLDAMVIVQKL